MALIGCFVAALSSTKLTAPVFCRLKKENSRVGGEKLNTLLSET